MHFLPLLVSTLVDKCVYYNTFMLYEIGYVLSLAWLSQEPKMRSLVHGARGSDRVFFRFFTEEAVLSVSSVYEESLLSSFLAKTLLSLEVTCFQGLPSRTLGRDPQPFPSGKPERPEEGDQSREIHVSSDSCTPWHRTPGQVCV
jgi:hypothetical protein